MSATSAKEPLLCMAAAAAGRSDDEDGGAAALPGESSSRTFVYDLLAEVLSNLDSDLCHGRLWAKSHNEMNDLHVVWSPSQ